MFLAFYLLGKNGYKIAHSILVLGLALFFLIFILRINVSCILFYSFFGILLVFISVFWIHKFVVIFILIKC